MTEDYTGAYEGRFTANIPPDQHWAESGPEISFSMAEKRRKLRVILAHVERAAELLAEYAREEA